MRAVEGLSEDLGAKRLRSLGLSRPVSDTRLHNVTAQLTEEGLCEELFRQVERGIARGDIKQDLLPHGAAAIDGKGAGSGMGKAPNDVARQSVCDADGSECWDIFTLRAVLVSSLARPCLTQKIIDGKTGEATAFPVLLEDVNKRFPGLVRYLTCDAGLCTASNARKVGLGNQFYVMGLKGNQPHLHQLALHGFAGEARPLATSFERAKGCAVDRLFYCIEMPKGDVEFPGATELWCVVSVKTDNDGAVEPETRYFVVSIPSVELTPDQKLLLVRLHWGIENNSNWTADVVLKEDTACPVNSGNGTLVVSWLNLLAMNLMSMFRATLAYKDKKPLAWKRVQDKIYQALFSTSEAPETSVLPD